MYEHIEVTPVVGAFGAEIGGVDLARPLDPDAAAEIRSALNTHHVVFFRDQDLTPVDQARFAEIFGELATYPFVAPVDEHSRIIPIIKEPGEKGNFGGGWHTDMVYTAEPPAVTVLYGIEIPSAGGDTLFADQCRAYDQLSDVMKDLLGGLEAVYNAAHAGDRSRHDKPGMKMTAGEDALEVRVTHPLVRTHPATGARSIYCSRPHTRRIKGMKALESKTLLDFLANHQTQPEITTRFSWRPGSMAVWDNRCVLHYAINDYPTERRHMHRCTVIGERPA